MQARLKGQQLLVKQDLTSKIDRADRAYKAAVENTYLSASGAQGLRGAFVVFEDRAVAQQVLADSPASTSSQSPCLGLHLLMIGLGRAVDIWQTPPWCSRCKAELGVTRHGTRQYIELLNIALYSVCIGPDQM
jgi:hypothetical protein